MKIYKYPLYSMTITPHMNSDSAAIEAEHMGSPDIDTATGVSRSWLPELAVVAACGLLIVAIGYNFSRIHETPFTHIIVWCGIGILYMPIAIRLMSVWPSRNERIGLVLIIGLGLFMVKVLHSPIRFTCFDEAIHIRGTANIVQEGRLFEFNPMLPTAAFYPGLHIITASFQIISSSSTYTSGSIVLVISKCMWVLSLFLFYEQVGRSSHLASIATLIYLSNPGYTFFNSQFAYESFALPIVAFFMFLIGRKAKKELGNLPGLNILLISTVFAIITTHHGSSYNFLLFITVFTVVILIMPQDQYRRKEILNIWFFICISLLTWLCYLAMVTFQYLVPQIQKGAFEFWKLISGEQEARTLFVAKPVSQASAIAKYLPLDKITTPFYEQYAAFAAVLFILAGLSVGMIFLLIKYRNDPLAITIAISVCMYPVSLILRFTGAVEISNRLSQSLYFLIGFVVATGIANFRPMVASLEQWLNAHGWVIPIFIKCQRIISMRYTGTAANIILGGIAMIILAGNLVAGWPVWGRVPGDYAMSADSRSITPAGLAVASWAHDILPPNQRFATDRVGRMLMTTIGGQRPITNYGDGYYVVPLYYSRTISPSILDLIKNADIDFVLIDLRMSRNLPVLSGYIEGSEPVWRNLVPVPIPIRRLRKYEAYPGVGRIFDNGTILIYDLRLLSR